MKTNDDPEFFTNCLDSNPNSSNYKFIGSSSLILSYRLIPNTEYIVSESQNSGYRISR